MAHSSTFNLRVDSDDKKHLLKALQICADWNKRVAGYRIRPADEPLKSSTPEGSGVNKEVDGFILFSHKDGHHKSGYKKLNDIKMSEACGLVWDWLGNVVYPSKPDMDDGPRKGFIVEDINWGSTLWHEEGDCAFAVVYPQWMEYWK